jgi:hypothetical protein
VAVVQFSHPVTSLPLSAISINEGQGIIEAVNSSDASGNNLCGGFTIRGKVAFDPWATLTTSVSVTIKGSNVTDVYGTTFPDAQNITSLDHRPRGSLFSTYMAYAGGGGVITSQQSVVLVLVFTEPVTGLTPKSFQVSGPVGPTISGLKLVRGTNSYYHLTVNVPGNYYGGVTVTVTGIVTDAAGNKNIPIDPLVFTRVNSPLLEGTAYRVLKSAAMQSLT